MGSDAVAGFRIKSGWAALVVLTGGPEHPAVCHAGVLQMSDPSLPETRQPYHNGRGVQEEDQAAIAGRSDVVARVTHTSVCDLLAHLAGKGLQVAGAAIVVGSMGDPARIANPHIRAHALEGRLFWKTLERELLAQAPGCSVFLEKDLFPRAGAVLQLDSADLAARLSVLGEGFRPWRLEQKQAAAAAWLALRG